VLRRSRRATLLAVLPLVLALSAVVATQTPARATVTVSDFAGTGTAGYSGDYGAATSAMLNQPQGVVADDIGNVYIFDNQNRRIRVVEGGSQIHTYLGDGSYCSSTGLSNHLESDNAGICSSTGYTITGEAFAGGPGGWLYFTNSGWLDQVAPDLVGDKWHIAGKVTGTWSPGDDANEFNVSVKPKSLVFSDSMYFTEPSVSSYTAYSIKRVTVGGGVTTIAGKPGTTTCNYNASDGDLAAGACIQPSYLAARGRSIYFFDAAPGWRARSSSGSTWTSLLCACTRSRGQAPGATTTPGTTSQPLRASAA
jgi:hypothetical protein